MIAAVKECPLPGLKELSEHELRLVRQRGVALERRTVLFNSAAESPPGSDDSQVAELLKDLTLAEHYLCLFLILRRISAPRPTI